jgi:hypothetical protein
MRKTKRIIKFIFALILSPLVAVLAFVLSLTMAFAVVVSRLWDLCKQMDETEDEKKERLRSEWKVK